MIAVFDQFKIFYNLLMFGFQIKQLKITALFKVTYWNCKLLKTNSYSNSKLETSEFRKSYKFKFPTERDT